MKKSLIMFCTLHNKKCQNYFAITVLLLLFLIQQIPLLSRNLFYDCLRVSGERGRRLSQCVGGGGGGSKAACEAKLEVTHLLPKFFYITEQFS